MSKSLGNTVNPLDLMKDYGADIMRLWALSVDFTEDHRIGKEILAGVADQYRKLRNTFRYLLGALAGFGEEERVAVEAMPELERYVLHLTAELDATLRQAVADFDFNTYVRALTDFCNEDLSRLLFRYPQGRPLLRRAGDGARPTAPRLSDGARHSVPRAGALARAGAGVHERGGVGHALSRCGLGAFARMAGRCPRSMPTRRSGPQLRELRTR